MCSPSTPYTFWCRRLASVRSARFAGGGGGDASLGRSRGPVTVPAHRAFYQVHLEVKVIDAGVLETK